MPWDAQGSQQVKAGIPGPVLATQVQSAASSARLLPQEASARLARHRSRCPLLTTLHPPEHPACKVF